jgi:hypothetical protein
MALEVKVKIGGDGTGFKAALDKARDQAKGFGTTLASGVLTKFGSAALSIIPTIADKVLSIFDPSKLFERIEQVVQRAKEIKIGSIRTGLDIETFQRVDNVMESVGLTAHSAAAAIDRLAKAQDEVNNGSVEFTRDTAKIAEAFAVLGVSIADVKSKSPQELFMQLGFALQSAANSGKLTGEQLAAIRTVLGRAGGELIPAFAKGLDTGTAADLANFSEKEVKNISELGEKWKLAKAILDEAYGSGLARRATDSKEPISMAFGIGGWLASTFLGDVMNSTRTDLTDEQRAKSAADAKRVADRKAQRDLATAEAHNVQQIEAQTAEMQRKWARDKMTADEKRLDLARQIAEVEDEALLARVGNDLAAAAFLDQKAAQLRHEADNIKDTKSTTATQRDPVDRLARIGLFASHGSNPILSHNQEQARHLATLVAQGQLQARQLAQNLAELQRMSAALNVRL